MIEFESFAFAAPPRTASNWFVNAATAVGIAAKRHTGTHQPVPRDWAGYTVSLVRHPFDWLYSYYSTFQGEILGVPCVDKFATFAKNCGTFEEFLKYFLRYDPGTLGKMFGCYSADSVMRIEDQPWAAIEFFVSLDIPVKRASQAQYVKPSHCSGRMLGKIDPGLRRAVMESEKELAERYDYY